MDAVADTQTKRSPSEGYGLPKLRPKRIRDHKKSLTRFDQRTVAWKRVVELRRLFAAAVVSAGFDLTPLRADLVEQAAAARALAEFARGRFMRGEASDLDDLLRAERRADAIVKKLGLLPERPRASVAVASPSSEPEPDLSPSELESLYALHADPRGLGTLGTPVWAGE